MRLKSSLKDRWVELDKLGNTTNYKIPNSKRCIFFLGEKKRRNEDTNNKQTNKYLITVCTL